MLLPTFCLVNLFKGRFRPWSSDLLLFSITIRLHLTRRVLKFGQRFARKRFLLPWWSLLSPKNMDDHGERAICEMNVSYPISCFWLFAAYFFMTQRCHPVSAICLDVVGISWQCGTVVFNFESMHVSGNLKAPQQCQGVQRADAIIGPVKTGGQHCVWSREVCHTLFEQSQLTCQCHSLTRPLHWRDSGDTQK